MDTEHHREPFSGGRPCLLQHPCANLPCSSAMTYIRDDETHHSSIISSPQTHRPRSDPTETSLGSMHPLKSLESHHCGIGAFRPAQGYHADSATSTGNETTRLYRSLENIPWTAISESSLDAHYRSLDGDFNLHWRSSRPSPEASAEKVSLRHVADICGHSAERIVGHRDPTAPPVHQWLLPTTEDKVAHGDAKRELKEKLRTHSSKMVEPNRPLRTPTYASNRAANVPAESATRQRCKCRQTCGSAATDSTNARRCASLVRYGTSPERIKQEAMRRLQLRRQNSFPDLALPDGDKESSGMVKSKTAESFKEQRPGSGSFWEADAAKTAPSLKGKLYLPTFEEFKRMRSKETGAGANSDVCQENTERSSKTKPGPGGGRRLPDMAEKRRPGNDDTSALVPGTRSQALGDPVETSQSGGGVTCGPVIAPHGSLGGRAQSPPYRFASSAPICSGPVPRSPFQALAVREAADLSGYGAKLQRMKDGLIGSALDLIKKSCSAETAAEPLARVSCDLPKNDTPSQEENNRSPAVSMATSSRETTSANGVAADGKSSVCSPGCRRSSSDMSHESAETGRSQRGCRLRTHFSDPMPTDAVKRKQLELKIAAAARHHAQRRRQDRDNGPVLTKANTTTSCSSGKDGGCTAGHSHRSRHRWSNISSLSTDSGIVGVNDDREEYEAPRPAKPGEVERADSGIGDALSRKWRAKVAEAAASLEAWEAHRPCTDCGERDSAVDIESRGKRRETLCSKCVMRRMERKEAILEFVNTESSYGEDLRIIKEEFYIPMQTAGLLTQDQLQIVFSNIQELIDLNEKFLEVLQEEIEQSLDQGDDDLMTVCIGEVFLEFVNMLPAFQVYCLQQSTSVATLNALEKEKELLRIFLDVSQNDNTALRRMNLRSFLMAPLQRVTKYPLLLSRILKSTTEFHPDHGSLWEAKSRIESHLEHINMKTKQEGNPWTLRSFRRDSRKNREVTNIEMREMAFKHMAWPREETRFIKEGALQMAQPTDGQWVRKGCKALKFQNVQALLMVNIRRTSESSLEGSSDNQTVKDAVLVLIKDKSGGKFVMLRDPLKLGHCVVSSDPDCEETFELLEIRREGFVFRDGDTERTQHWYRQIKNYSRELGSWKKRRNALPNIMISTAQNRF
ncbi:uncharacterized protein LOC128502169 isoform X2 [Spea bombifrons]|uniref:uncharacterized protein LOC128502169 isoform X2 n=1 Tax=Spea bombifrons TaxID=233779 RepID=UPI00234912FD|nr:uncharacterized protein LOC128502169 isoform X2 [Spea bombifrons]